MKNQDQYGLPELPPIEDVVKHIKSPEQKPISQRKLPAEELIAQLKQHFGKDDLGKLVSALGEDVEFEKTTTCPILGGKIKIIRKKNGGNSIVCQLYHEKGYHSKSGSAYDCPATGCGFTYKVCPYADAQIF